MINKSIGIVFGLTLFNQSLESTLLLVNLHFEFVDDA